MQGVRIGVQYRQNLGIDLFLKIQVALGNQYILSVGYRLSLFCKFLNLMDVTCSTSFTLLSFRYDLPTQTSSCIIILSTSMQCHCQIQALPDCFSTILPKSAYTCIQFSFLLVRKVPLHYYYTFFFIF